MAIVRYVLAKLRPGVSREDYERFEREVDYVVAGRLKTIVSYRTHRITGTDARLAGGPWDYIERIEITDRAAYEKELGSWGRSDRRALRQVPRSELHHVDLVGAGRAVTTWPGASPW